MPTTLPDPAARARHQRRLAFAELAPIAAAVFYLLLLAWTMASLEASLIRPFEPAHRLGDYNPMEPGHGTNAGWRAQR